MDKQPINNQTREARLKAYQEAVEQVLGKQTPVSNQLKKGDIFYTSWGYDQTNYDYIVVLEVSKTGKTCKCQRTSSIHMGETAQTNVQEPVFCPFGDVFTMRVGSSYKGSLSLRGSYPFCHDGKGSKRLDGFSRHIEGKQYHETDAYSGH